MAKQYGVKTHLLLREKNSTDRYILLMQKIVIISSVFWNSDFIFVFYQKMKFFVSLICCKVLLKSTEMDSVFIHSVFLVDIFVSSKRE